MEFLFGLWLGWVLGWVCGDETPDPPDDDRHDSCNSPGTGG